MAESRGSFCAELGSDRVAGCGKSSDRLCVDRGGMFYCELKGLREGIRGGFGEIQDAAGQNAEVERARGCNE